MMMMMKTKAKLPPPMSGWQEMTGMGWADIDMKVMMVVVMFMIAVKAFFYTDKCFFQRATRLNLPIKTSPQAKRHQSSLLITSLAISTSLTVITG